MDSFEVMIYDNKSNFSMQAIFFNTNVSNKTIYDLNGKGSIFWVRGKKDATLGTDVSDATGCLFGTKMMILCLDNLAIFVRFCFAWQPSRTEQIVFVLCLNIVCFL